MCNWKRQKRNYYVGLSLTLKRLLKYGMRNDLIWKRWCILVTKEKKKNNIQI